MHITKNTNSPARRATAWWAAVLACMAAIYYLSAQSALGGMQAPAWFQALRKSGHIVEYGALGWLLGEALISTWLARGSLVTRALLSRAWLLGVVIATAYAATDEYHQTFVPRRGGHIEDVLVDALSATVALGILYILRTRRSRARARTLEQT